MTAGEIITVLKKVPKDTPVMTRDHDHSTYECNGPVRDVQILNQKDMTEYEKSTLYTIFQRKGKYVVMSA